jgi:SpoVK/Ycf46/Vps4 family AAA+-type ATPase
MTGEERQRIALQFQEAVNLEPVELEAWLETDESKAVGFKRGGRGESVGHASGRRIVRLLHTPSEDLTADDYRHMGKVVGYVHRHLAQPPRGDVTATRWRYSLLNWGHDPLR